jgi:uncharacterized surface protein with fasciclin (FAS1) repeats
VIYRRREEERTMKYSYRGIAALAAVIAAGALAAGAGRATAAAARKDIVDTAASAPQFSTLVTAVKAAGLVETLKGPGPFTVFAPTNDAFARVPKEKLNALLADKSALTEVLTYHVVPGKVTAADVIKLTEAKTVQGGKLAVRAGNGVVTVDGARVVKTDIHCSNGVIHVIDAVVMPKK